MWADAALDLDGRLGELWERPERIEDVGTPIVLGDAGELAEISERLVESIHRENELANAGVTCRVKTIADASCHACPLYRADGSPMAELCAIGREQERLCTLIAVHHHGR